MFDHDMTRRMLQVVMEQLWNHIYVRAKDPHLFLAQTCAQMFAMPLCQLLSTLHQNKIDWTDASLWPEDYIEGQWKRVVPMSFLVANVGSNPGGTLWLIKALCSGECCPLLPCGISCARCGSSTPRNFRLQGSG